MNSFNNQKINIDNKNINSNPISPAISNAILNQQNNININASYPLQQQQFYFV